MIFAELDISLWAYVIAFIVIFLAQIYGAFASGDGLIIQPVLVGLGVPANVVMANDTTGSFFGGVSSGWLFHKNKMMPYKTLYWWFPGVLIGPVFGALLLSHLSLFILEVLVFMSAITGAIYFLLRRYVRKNRSEDRKSTRKESKMIACLSGVLIGFLTGLGLGGVGIVNRLLLVFNGLDMKEAMAVSQIVGNIPVIPAFISYLLLGLISPMFLIIISVAFFGGSYVGTLLVIKTDTRLLEKIFMISTIAVAGFILLSKL